MRALGWDGSGSSSGEMELMGQIREIHEETKIIKRG